MAKGRAVTPNALWESWRTGFRAQIRDELSRRDLKQKDLAPMVGLSDSSSVSYHMAGKGPSHEFVQAIARLWPDRFADAPSEFRAAYYGESPSDSGVGLQASLIVSYLDAVEDAFAELRRAILDLSPGGDDEERAGEAGKGGDSN